MSGNIVKSQEIGNSSQIKKLAYTDEGNLIVTFIKGTDYLYKGVPEQIYEDLVKSESVGKMLNSAVKGKFEYVQILPKGNGQ